MKTHEFARHLELLARLLRSLPDTELDDSIATELQSTIPGLAPASAKEGRRPPRPLAPGLEKQLLHKSPAEIEALLGSKGEAFTVAQLTELAERLGVATSKRQSKNALINLITRYFEAGQMHSIMRSARNET